MNQVATGNEQEEWDIILRPRSKWYDIDLKGIWHYRDLIRLFVRRDFVAQYKQTILGPLWMLMQPLFSTLFYALVFGKIAKLPTGGLPPAVFIMTALIGWTYFADCISKTGMTFTSNAYIFGKVYFPRLVTPISVLFSSLFKFFIQLFLLLLLFSYYHFFKGIQIQPDYHLAFLPLLVLLLGAMGMAIGLIVSSMTARYRDLSFLVTFVLQFLMYGSSVVISFHVLGPKLESILRWNPLVWVIEAFRYALIGSGIWSWWGLLYAFCWTIFLLGVGVLLFGRVEKTFMDTV